MSLFDFCKENSIKVLTDEPMKKRTTFKVGGPARFFVTVETEEELRAVYLYCKENSVETLIIGAGSNLLFCDEGFSGAVISLKGEFSNASVKQDTVTAGAGVMLSRLCNIAKENSLSGLEFAFGIPGTVGGAVFMNAGAYGGEIKDVLVSVKTMDKNGNIKTYLKTQASLGYRTSIFQDNGEIILSARFKLLKGDTLDIETKMNELLGRRKEKQPLEYGSAGSTFKRPLGYFAAALIEECGLKGRSVGDAEVSRKHSGFIINKGNASASDVLELIDIVKETVYKQKNVNLECEVKIVGGRN